MSFAASFAAHAAVARPPRRTPALVRTTAGLILAGAALGLAPGPLQAEVTEFDWDSEFKVPHFLIHITETSTLSGVQKRDSWILYPKRPDDDGHLQIADGAGGWYHNMTDRTLGPFKTPAQVCIGAGDAVGNRSFEAEGRSWSSSDYQEYTKKLKVTGFWGFWAIVLTRLAITKFSILLGVLGVGAGAVAVYVWTHGAPGPLRTTPILNKYLERARGAATGTERSALRGLSPEEARELGVEFETLTPDEKKAAAEALGVEYQKLPDALKDLADHPTDSR